MATDHDTLLRQWSMLRKIPRYPQKITARILTESLRSDGYSIAKRTIERDLLELSHQFPLVLDDSERPYGWSWQKDAPAFDLPGLDHHESLMLVMAEEHLAKLLPCSTIEILKPYFSAAHKKLETLPKSKGKRSWLDKVRTVLPQQPLISPTIHRKVQQVISEALLDDKQVEITYKRRGSKDSQVLRVHPLALIQRGGVIYLYARIFDYMDTRLLAMHRIASAEKCEDETVIPKDFDLDADIEKGRFGFGDGKTIRLELSISADVAEHLEESPLSKDQKLTSATEGQYQLSATVPETPQLNWWLLSLGEGVEVVSPAELRTEIQSIIKRMLTNYQS